MLVLLNGISGSPAGPDLWNERVRSWPGSPGPGLPDWGGTPGGAAPSAVPLDVEDRGRTGAGALVS